MEMLGNASGIGSDKAPSPTSDQTASVEVTLRVDGMHCGSCIRRVTQAINSSGSLEVKEVRLGAARFSVPANGEPAMVGQAIAALAKAGFAARVDS